MRNLFFKDDRYNDTVYDLVLLPAVIGLGLWLLLRKKA